MKKLLIPVLLLAQSACLLSNQLGDPPTSTIKPAAHEVMSANTSSSLATVNNHTIAESNLPAEILQELRKTENEWGQRRLHLLWAGTTKRIRDELLRAEAERQTVTVPDLIQAEVYEKTVNPTDNEVRALYEQYREKLGVPFQKARPYLQQQLIIQRREEHTEAFVGQLKKAARIEYSLPVPALPRFGVSHGNGPSDGPADAPVTIVEFADFECPYCARAHKLLKRLRKSYPNKVKVVYRDFPLSRHTNARPAAEAAQCAHEQGQFWAYSDILYERSNDLGASALRTYASELKLNLETFEECLTSGRPQAAVAASEQDGQKFGVEGTPSIYINGIKLIGLLPLPLIEAIIDSEIERHQ